MLLSTTHKAGADAPLLRTWVIGLIYALFSVLLSSCDLFGIDSAADEANNRAVQTLLAPFYGRDCCAPEGEVREKIQVVLFNDESYHHSGWPIPYSRLQQFLETLAEMKVASVFVDLVLTLPRYPEEGMPAAGDAAFCKLAHQLMKMRGGQQQRSQGAADDWLRKVLYFDNEVKDDSVDPNCISNAKALAEDESRRLTTIPAWARAAVAYKRLKAVASQGTPVLLGADLNYLLDPNAKPHTSAWAKHAILDRVAVLVPISVGTDDQQGYRHRVSSYNLPSPAILLRAALVCKDSIDESGGSLPGCRDNHEWVATDGSLNLTDASASSSSVPDTAYIMWGGFFTRPHKQPDEHSLYTNADCDTLPDRARYILSGFLFGMSPGTTAGAKVASRSCAHHNTIPFEYLAPARTAEIEQADIDSARLRVRNSHVFFGANFAMLDDSVRAPLQGDIAAVHSHAMAFDNLLSLQTPYAYRKETPLYEFASAGLKFAIVFFSVTLLLAFRDSRFVAKSGMFAPPTSAGPAITQRFREFLAVIFAIAIATLAATGLHGVVTELSNASGFRLRTGDVGALVLLTMVFLLSVWSLIDSFRASATEKFTRSGISPGATLELLVPHLSIALLFLVSVLVLSALFTVGTHWPPANVLSPYLFVIAAQLLIFGSQLQTAFSYILPKEVANVLI